MKLLENNISAGCALKMSPFELNNLLNLKNYEDAYITKIGNINLVQSVDILAPIVNNPYYFGQIALANSLSDLYAKGSIPISAMNIACFPEINEENKYTFQSIIEGGNDLLHSIGLKLSGGHSITDKNIKFGYSVTGIADKYSDNSKLKDGDLLFISKSIGIGLLVSALKSNILDVEDIIINNCIQLNTIGIDLIQKYGIETCTDITGYGLGGHLINLLISSNVTAKLYNIPTLNYVKECMEDSIQPLRTHQNIQYYQKYCNLTHISLDILFDPQTSGGLLFGVSEKKYNLIKSFLNENDCKFIGIVTKKQDYCIID